MIKYRLMDLNDNEFFADEWEARERLKSWLYMAQDNARSALASAQPEEIRRWKRDEDFYRSSGALGRRRIITSPSNGAFLLPDSRHKKASALGCLWIRWTLARRETSW